MPHTWKALDVLERAGAPELGTLRLGESPAAMSHPRHTGRIRTALHALRRAVDPRGAAAVLSQTVAGARSVEDYLRLDGIPASRPAAAVSQPSSEMTVT